MIHIGTGNKHTPNINGLTTKSFQKVYMKEHTK
jgi:hypothetical protein